MSQGKLVTDYTNKYFTGNKVAIGTAQPTSGTYNAGDIVISKTPNSSSYGWICTASGTPGSWKVLKSAADLTSFSWSQVAGKPSTFTPTIGNTSTTAFRGDLGQVAYNHSQSAHAPTNAQKNSDITKAEIEAKLTGSVTSHAHNYAAVSHGNHVPATQSANNSVFLRNDNTWQTIQPNRMGGFANFALPPSTDGKEDWVKLCSVTETTGYNHHAEFLISGFGNFGLTGHGIGILRVSGRMNATNPNKVRFVNIMPCDGTQPDFGIVSMGGYFDVWMHRPEYDGGGAITVLGMSEVGVEVFRNQVVSKTKPQYLQGIVNMGLMEYPGCKIVLGNNLRLSGIRSDVPGDWDIFRVDDGNNICIGWGNQTYINVNNSMRIIRDIHVQSGASIVSPALRVKGSSQWHSLGLGGGHTRLEYNEDAVYVAGDDYNSSGYRMPFRANTMQSMNNCMKYGDNWFTIDSGSWSTLVNAVWFRNR